VVVAVIVVVPMELPVDEIIHMTGVRHRFVAALDPVLVATAVRVVSRRAIRVGDLVHEVVLVDVPTVHEVQVPVVDVIDMIVVTNGHVPAVRAVIVVVVLVMNEVPHGRLFIFPAASGAKHAAHAGSARPCSRRKSRRA